MKRKPALTDKHYERAVDAIALHRCSTDLTDGFCGPRDGRCPGHDENRPDRCCIVSAKGILDALASRGMIVVWVFDKELPPELQSLKEGFEIG